MVKWDEEGYKKLDPKCKVALYIGYAISFIILSVILVAVWFFYVADQDWRSSYIVLTAVILVLLLVYVIAAPQIFYMHYRYRITDDRIDVRRGIIIIRRTVVPIERIHQVEVTRGPINNLFGLADVDVTTAGGVAAIQFLNVATADRIAEDLNDYINNIVRSRKEDDQT
ncbi:MAG: PH domain-containing protein [Candidatus Methanoplasma sp.]|jgi:membrane protein YdbS with pleckstrin-like domain|nr:PH domain-containing protein [Candidatus Methanoplasma sp.]